MISVFFGVGAALGFGSSDFFGGLAARQIGSLRTVWITAMTALAALYLGTFVLIGSAPPEAWLFGGLSGAAGVIALVCLYASLAIGPMSIVSPIGAVLGAVVPTAWDIVIGEPLSWWAYGAIVLALVAVAIVGFTPGENVQRVKARGLALSLVAGFLFGVYYILLDLAPDDSGLWPLVANRGVSVIVMTLVVAGAFIGRFMRRRARANQPPHETSDILAGDVGVIHWRLGLQIAVITGVLEALSTSLFLYGIVSGSLTVVAVLTSLYPAVTIVLASVFLREHISRTQYIGLAVAGLAVVGLALV